MNNRQVYLVIGAMIISLMYGNAFAQPAPPVTQIYFGAHTETRSSGDVIGGTVYGSTGYHGWWDTYGTPISGGEVTWTLASPKELTWVETESGKYLRGNSTGAKWSPVSGQLDNNWNNYWSETTPGVVDVNLPLTFSRSVDTPIISDGGIQNMRVELTVDSALPADINGFSINIAEWEIPWGVNYNVLSSSTSPSSPFAGGPNYYWADPTSLVVGQTYWFDLELEVEINRPAGQYYSMPFAHIDYQQHLNLPDITATSQTLALPDGTTAQFAANEMVQFHRNYSPFCYNLNFEPIFAAAQDADITEVFIVRGQSQFADASQDVHEFSIMIDVDSAKMVEVTTPTGLTVEAEADDDGEWEVWFETMDVGDLSDFGAGVYTITAYDADGSGTDTVEVTLQADPGLTQTPNITSDLESSDIPMVLTWDALTDPNANGIHIGIESDDYDEQAFLLASDTEYDFGQLNLGGYNLDLGFGELIEGYDAVNDFDWLTAWHLSTRALYNQVPLAGDYNHDGTVDQADYTVWADSYGDSGVNLLADGNGDGVIDQADYTVWADHYGDSLPSALATVPEPATFTLIALAGLMLNRRRR